MATTWSARALALCMAGHDRLGASCLDAVRSVASSRDLVCAIMWHVFPHDAPLIVKVQYISEKLNIEAEQSIVEVVARATKKLKLADALNGVPLNLKIDGVLDVLLDRTSSALPPSTPDLMELKTDVHAAMLAKCEAAWRAMQEARRQNIAPDHAAAAAATTTQVVRSEGSEESIRKWLCDHCISFPEGASLAELEALVAEERAAIAEEEAAMAQYNASMAARGQPTVVSAISTCGPSRTVLDEAREGEELARRELMDAAREADVLAATPVVVGSVAVSLAAESTSSALAVGGLPVVMAEAVSDENLGRRPKGGIAALTNMLHIS
jgi:hypothetical protein